jgi:diacylglycerol kinase family enzyme
MVKKVVRIEADSDEVVRLEIDGEAIGRLPVSVEMLPKSLKVTVP